MIHPQDPDDLYGDAPFATIEICCRRNGSLSVKGSIENLPYALAMLDNARDAIKGFHARKQANKAADLIVPKRDILV